MSRPTRGKGAQENKRGRSMCTYKIVVNDILIKYEGEDEIEALAEWSFQVDLSCSVGEAYGQKVVYYIDGKVESICGQDEPIEIVWAKDHSPS
jgi:hypothetical protein